MPLNGKLLVALPKGRLYEPARALLARAGLPLAPDAEGSRRLITTDESGRCDVVSLKPSDIPVYVESGAIDAGIAGSDVLREFEPDVYEPVDLRMGLCRLVLAAPEGREFRAGVTIRVATKYPRTAEKYFRARKMHAHIVRLDGSVEIAPLLNLADGIVDLVETGRTLRENGLRVIDEIAQVSAKLIVNRTAMKMKSEAVQSLIATLDAVVYENP